MPACLLAFSPALICPDSRRSFEPGAHTYSTWLLNFRSAPCCLLLRTFAQVPRGVHYRVKGGTGLNFDNINTSLSLHIDHPRLLLNQFMRGGLLHYASGKLVFKRSSYLVPAQMVSFEQFLPSKNRDWKMIRIGFCSGS